MGAIFSTATDRIVIPVVLPDTFWFFFWTRMYEAQAAATTRSWVDARNGGNVLLAHKDVGDNNEIQVGHSAHRAVATAAEFSYAAGQQFSIACICASETGEWTDILINGVRIRHTLGYEGGLGITSITLGNLVEGVGDRLLSGEIGPFILGTHSGTGEDILERMAAMHHAGPTARPYPDDILVNLPLLENYQDISGNGNHATNAGTTLQASDLPRTRKARSAVRSVGGKKVLVSWGRNSAARDTYSYNRITQDNLWSFVIVTESGGDPDQQYVLAAPPFFPESHWWASRLTRDDVQGCYDWGCRRFHFHLPWGAIGTGPEDIQFIFDTWPSAVAGGANTAFLHTHFLEDFSAWMLAHPDAYVKFYMGNVGATSGFNGLTGQAWNNLFDASMAPIRALHSQFRERVRFSVDESRDLPTSSPLWTRRNELATIGLRMACEAYPTAANSHWGSGDVDALRLSFGNRVSAPELYVPDNLIAGSVMVILDQPALWSLDDLRRFAMATTLLDGRPIETCAFLDAFSQLHTWDELTAYP